MDDLLNLKGKRILITGASSGIGKAAAIQISKVGGTCVLVARNIERLEKTVSDMSGDGHSYYSCDLSQIESIEPLIKQAVEDSGPFDGFIHCAGIGDMRPISMLKITALHNVMAINFYSFIEIVRCLTKRGCYNDYGVSIIAMSSVASEIGQKTNTSYAASKAAIDGAIRCLAKELYTRKIRVNSLAAAMVSTDMYEEYKMKSGDSEVIMDRQYLGVINPFEIADGIIYLLSDLSKSITGTRLVIDGGYSS